MSLSVKFAFPTARRNLVDRPRLVERLSIGLRGPLTLLSAPAGYGKTTLLSAWHAGLDCPPPAARLAFDIGDGDPVSFLAHIAAALESLRAGLVSNTVRMLQPPQRPPLDSILTSLAEEWGASPEGIVLVLDDYHLAGAAIHEIVAFLLAHGPPQMHLAILTREDPPLPLPRLRARGQMIEIRENDLRFSPEEAAAFLAQTMGLTLSEKAVATLVERTEGWIAGLQMAGLSLQARNDAEEMVAAFRGQDRFVMDFLMDEVFTRQPEDIQCFLIETSIVDRLSGPLCDSLLGLAEPDHASARPPALRSSFETSQDILEHLEHANLFVLPLDNEREWYRYHPLFADLLRYRLQRFRPERLPELHRRACCWYVQAGDPDGAMKHALAVPDYELVADVAEQFLLHMTGGNCLVTYLSWIQQLPDEVVCRRAYLCAGCGWAYVLTHQVDRAGQYLDWGDTALSRFEPIYSAPDKRWITRQEVYGSLAAIRSYADRLRGDLPGATQHARDALDVLPREALAVRCMVALNLGMLHLDCGEMEMARKALFEAFETADKSQANVYVATSALSLLGGTLIQQGKLKEAESIFQRAIRLGTGGATPAGPIPGVEVVHGWLVAVYYQRNEIAPAQEYLDVVLQSVAPMGVAETSARAYLYQALLAQSRGELSAAEDWLQRAEQLIGTYPMQELIRTEWIVFRGQLHLARDDLDSALDLLAAQGVRATDLDAQPATSQEQARWLRACLARYLFLARALLAQRELEQAARLLEKVSPLAEGSPDFPLFLEALALQAVVAVQRQGDTAHAMAILKRALNLAAPEGYQRPFLNAGEPLLGLLRQAIAQGIQPSFAHTLHAELARQQRQQISGRLFDGRAPRGATATPAGSSGLVEPLTGRERQVLRLLAAGLSSTEVAEQLVISVSTARSYVKSIYAKLDAHGRDEAIEQAKHAGML